jgi:MFS transporter, FSR family, fosmidomycin resistance protein
MTEEASVSDPRIDQAEPSPPDELLDKRAARGIIGAHSLKHAYQQGFYVLLPEIYTSLGLSPVAAGAVETVRRVSSGTFSMAGGFFLDRFRDKRVPALYLSLLVMGIGYFLMGAAPTYPTLLLAIGLAGAASSLWHPAALGLLSEAFPRQRGLMISLHRSTGSIGDAVGPLLVGGLLVIVAWQSILFGALPLAVLFALALRLTLGGATARTDATEESPAEVRPLGQQLRAVGGLLRIRGLRMLLLITGLNGLGQGGLVLWLGLYLRETQGMGSVGIGIHVALLTGVGIVAGPLIGGFSDRVGRKPVITGVLFAKAAIAVLLALAVGGWIFSALVALMGAVMFGVNSLIQAAALDVADGHKLEGSTIGLLWGSNAIFVGISPLVVGFLIESFGYGVLFWYVAVANLVAALTATVLPVLGETDQRRAAV